MALAECKACDGRGYHIKRVTVYEHGCGFPHDDTEEIRCDECGGAGDIVVESSTHSTSE